MYFSSKWFSIFLLIQILPTDLALPAASVSPVCYVWCGQDSSVANAADFVAVVDCNRGSKTYGFILKTVPLVSDETAGIIQIGNEPHHSAISLDGRYYISGGLLSFLQNKKEIFVWSIPPNPADGPQFLYALNVSGACPDEFLAVGDSEFIVSMMCNDAADSPGDMVSIDAAGRTARSILQNPDAISNFNPHGFSRLGNGSIFVGDYIKPITLVGNDPSQIVFRNTARHFLPDGSLERTFQFQMPTGPGTSTGLGQGIGFMELKNIPGDPLGRAFACGTNTNYLYLIGPGMPQPLAVLDVSQVNGYKKFPSAGILSMLPDGKRMLMTFQMRFVILVDISQPEEPKFLRVFDFCTDKTLKNFPILDPISSQQTTFPEFCSKNNNVVGSHAIVHLKGENRFIVLNYFINFGMAQFSGLRTMHAFIFSNEFNNFQYDHTFNPNFQFNDLQHPRPTFHSLQAYPHHAVYISSNN